MKVLFLVQKEQRAILDRLYDGIAEHCDCDKRELTSEEQDDLRGYFRKHVDVTRYDRIVFFLRFKKEIRQVRFIQTLPNLVILEHDAYQNYIPCKYTGKFSAHYRKLPWARVISSGFMVSRALARRRLRRGVRSQGIRPDAAARLRVVNGISSWRLSAVPTASPTVAARHCSMSWRRVESMVVTRTKSGEEYCDTLNRIRFFVSADVGMGEFMIKNFEAMACGCVLLAYDQGSAESSALGLQDMHNVVLYQDIPQLQQKLAVLRADPELAQRIASNGRELAVSQFSFARIGQRIVEELEPALRPRAPLGLLEKVRLKLGV